MDPTAVVVRYLELRRAAARPLGASLPPGFALAPARPCPVPLYRQLQEAIGGPGRWNERSLLNDEQLGAELARPTTAVFVLFQGDLAVGCFELDASAPYETDLRYLGLIPQFIGRGLGAFLVQSAFDEAWSRPIERVLVQTSSLDHPAALKLYLRAGARVYREREVMVDDSPS